MSFMLGFAVGLYQARLDAEREQKMRAGLSPEAFRRWDDERTAERRHRELCRSIEKAGENARPRGLEVFW